MIRWLPLAIILPALAACGPGVRVADVNTPAAHQTTTAVTVVNGPAPAGARLVGAVEATSCKNKAWDATPTNENAITQLKAFVKERGGNTLANVFCEPPQGTTLSPNCWSSIRCTGTAYSVQS